MKIDEFKIWLDGYCSGIQGNPSAPDMERIRSKLAEVAADNGGPIYAPPIVIFPPGYPNGAGEIPCTPAPYWQNPIVTCDISWSVNEHRAAA